MKVYPIVEGHGEVDGGVVLHHRVALAPGVLARLADAGEDLIEQDIFVFYNHL